MLWDALTAARDLGRLKQIAAVLIRYGFGDIVQRVGMAAALQRAGEALRWRTIEGLTELAPPVRLRRALEDLGPTFVKLGQILATRVDLLPPDWAAELAKLQDAAPPVPISDVWKQLKEDLGDAPEAVFAEVEREPLAAASLAQVHRARLPDGTAVILKVRRPGVRQVIEADLQLLNRLADIVETEAPDMRRYRPREVMAQFTQSLRLELDFTSECRNAQRIRENLAAYPDIVVPRVHWRWCGERLNVQDCIRGIPGRDLAAVDAAGLDRKLLARRGAQAVLKMIFEDGFYHADPHPGNIFYLPENGIAFIDFGMVGRLSETRRYELALLLYHLLVKRDSASAADVLLEWGDGRVEAEELASQIEALLDRYYGVELRQFDFGAYLSDVVNLLREHGLALPPELALLIKAFISLQGMGRQLDPEFDIVSECAPFFQGVLLGHYAPSVLAERGRRTLGSALRLLNELPTGLSDFLRAARQGKQQTQMDVVSLRPLAGEIDRSANRMAVSMVTASLVVGSSIVLAAGVRPKASRLSSLGRFGLVGALIGGAWLTASIRRSGRGT